MQVDWNTIKNLLMITITGIISIVTNFQHTFIALFVGFIFNFLMGMGADAKDKTKESFNMKKATEGIKLLMFYVVTIFCIYGMTYKEPTLANTIIKWLTYIVSYFYLTNIFRNAKSVFPENKSIDFIYMFLSTEVFYRLKEYLGFRKKDKDENK